MTTSSHVDKTTDSNLDRKIPLKKIIDIMREEIKLLKESNLQFKESNRQSQESNRQFTKQMNRKSIIMICAISGIAIVLLLGNYCILHIEKTGNKSTLSSGYEIQNLKGDKVNTWVSWKIMSGDLFHIHVLASPLLTDERMSMIKDVIFSTKTSQQDGRTYYQGWLGALDSINNTKYTIPIHLHTIPTNTGTGNVLIKLTDLSSPDGYSGYTKSITDEGNHQILKSTVTIYNVNELSPDDFKLVLRHELGHAFGLAHSDDPNDLMSTQISRDYPYISQCDTETLTSLYNGNEKSQVTCTK
jgi:hypothetical protein